MKLVDVKNTVCKYIFIELDKDYITLPAEYSFQDLAKKTETSPQNIGSAFDLIQKEMHKNGIVVTRYKTDRMVMKLEAE